MTPQNTQAPRRVEYYVQTQSQDPFFCFHCKEDFEDGENKIIHIVALHSSPSEAPQVTIRSIHADTCAKDLERQRDEDLVHRLQLPARHLVDDSDLAHAVAIRKGLHGPLVRAWQCYKSRHMRFEPAWARTDGPLPSYDAQILADESTEPVAKSCFELGQLRAMFSFVFVHEQHLTELNAGKELNLISLMQQLAERLARAHEKRLKQPELRANEVNLTVWTHQQNVTSNFAQVRIVARVELKESSVKKMYEEVQKDPHFSWLDIGSNQHTVLSKDSASLTRNPAWALKQSCETGIVLQAWHDLVPQLDVAQLNVGISSLTSETVLVRSDKLSFVSQSSGSTMIYRMNTQKVNDLAEYYLISDDNECLLQYTGPLRASLPLVLDQVAMKDLDREITRTELAPVELQSLRKRWSSAAVAQDAVRKAPEKPRKAVKQPVSLLM